MRDRASDLRAIADGRLMLNVRNGVTVSRSMLAMIADEFEAMSTALEAQAAELAAVKEMYAREGAKALYELERAERAEALSRTGAVKPLDLSNLLRHAFFEGFMVAGGSQEAAAEWWPEYDPETCAAYSRILSALEPAAPRTCTCHPDDNPPDPCTQKFAYSECVAAAPEGQQEPVAWRYKLFESDPKWTVTTEKPKGVVVEPLFTRPAERAVTEAMVEAAVQAVRQYTRDTLFIDEHRELVRTALKAAMEAGG